MAEFQKIIFLVFILAVAELSVAIEENLADECFHSNDNSRTKVLEFLFGKTPVVSAAESKLTFIMESSSTLRITVNADVKKEVLEDTTFKPEIKTIFIIHGFKSTATADWVKAMTNAYNQLGDANVIAVNWGEYASKRGLRYLLAVGNLRNAASEIVAFMNNVMEAYPEVETWGKIHLVGHSLGAHVSGLVAKELKRLDSKWQIARITGLDPAKPCIVGGTLSLSKNDAPFVDIIHTHGWFFGIKAPIGHIDFYVNGGMKQPGCHEKKLSASITKAALLAMVCSHGRSYEYFTQSVRFEGTKSQFTYWGQKYDYEQPRTAQALLNHNCPGETCVEMGINAEKYQQQSGTFFVAAGPRSPFIEMSSEDLDMIGKQLEEDE